MLPVEKTPLAKSDLLEIWQYIALDNPAAADRVIREIDAKIATLSEYAHPGRQRDELAPGLRSTPVGKYIVFYRVQRAMVEVVRVVHGARNLPSLFETNG